ncbi:DUF4167 domain-containing protein [Alphaproteobacteria bacterium]|nr:DUF4167 domain-containing protein [Alphaproteobacteria bacterium]
MKKNMPFRRSKNRPFINSSMNGANGSVNNFKTRQRPRGNPLEVRNKYESLAKDATSAGDRVAAENYMQHAEHFLRINNDAKKPE